MVADIGLDPFALAIHDRRNWHLVLQRVGKLDVRDRSRALLYKSGDALVAAFADSGLTFDR
jgi:hypothetical protein